MKQKSKATKIDPTTRKTTNQMKKCQPDQSDVVGTPARFQNNKTFVKLREQDLSTILKKVYVV